MWSYKDHPVTSHDDLPEEITDIVYCIGYTDGKRYIGKKSIRSERRVKPTKERNRFCWNSSV